MFSLRAISATMQSNTLTCFFFLCVFQLKTQNYRKRKTALTIGTSRMQNRICTVICVENASFSYLLANFIMLTLSVALTSAPCSNNRLTTDSCPYQAARWRGVNENWKKNVNSAIRRMDPPGVGIQTEQCDIMHQNMNRYINLPCLEYKAFDVNIKQAI